MNQRDRGYNNYECQTVLVPVTDLPSLAFFRRLRVGLDIFRTNSDSQWNPVYNALHRIFGCGN